MAVTPEAHALSAPLLPPRPDGLEIAAEDDIRLTRGKRGQSELAFESIAHRKVNGSGSFKRNLRGQVHLPMTHEAKGPHRCGPCHLRSLSVRLSDWAARAPTR